MTTRLPGHWFYEVAHCDCGCQIITAGRTQLQRGETLYCEKHKRVVKVVYSNVSTLAQQAALCRVDEPMTIANKEMTGLT